MVEYSSHDWRKYTDDAIVKDAKSVMKVNESVVIFTDPKERRTYEVDVSRLIRVFVNNRDSHKRSVK
jgi:hypothetical protein